MNHRFALPVAVALAVHASVLFGFRKASPPLPSNPSPVKTDDRRIQLPPDEIELVDLSRQPVRAGSPDVSRPEPEVIAPSLKPPVFPIDNSPPAPTRIAPIAGVSWDPPGQPGGMIDGGSIIPVGVLDNPPNARVRIPPDYPFAAKQAGLQGEVMVEFSVDETGRVFNPLVLNSTDRVFEESTLRAVAKWSFAPGKRDGRTVKFRMAVPVVFRLNGD